MRILILNRTFHPDVASKAQYVSDVAATLAARGHEVTVVCSRRAYNRPSERYGRRDTWRGIDIHRLACTGFGKKAKWRRALDFGTFIISCTLHLFTLRQHDLVLGMTSPPLISWIGAMFTRLKGGRFAFWVMDLNPDEAIAAGWLKDGTWVTRALQWILNDSLRHSALVIALDRHMARRLEAKGVDPGRIQTLPPWSHDDAVHFDVEGRTAFRRAHELDGKFVVMYSGNHSPSHPLTTLMRAARVLRKRSDIVFCFVGGGSEQATVREFACQFKLTNVLVLPYQPLSQLAGSLSAADLHVVVMGDRYVGIVHPCKVYNIRAVGVPYLYIGPSESHVTELRPDFAAAHGNVEAVVSHIQAVAARGPLAGVPIPADGADLQSRDRLLPQLIQALERTGGAPVTDTVPVATL